MVRAWYMDDDVESDQRLEHHRSPQEFVDLNKLYSTTGVRYFKVNDDFSIKWEISEIGNCMPQ
jgi:1,2-dihydroxy-3-keto-5-methylthiopentene dioxygenase